MYRVLYIDQKGKCDEIILREQDFELFRHASNVQILSYVCLSKENAK
jgi:hypothetical protein